MSRSILISCRPRGKQSFVRSLAGAGTALLCLTACTNEPVEPPITAGAVPFTSETTAPPDLIRLTATLTTRMSIAAQANDFRGPTETQMRLDATRNMDGTWRLLLERPLPPGLATDPPRRSPVSFEVSGELKDGVLRDAFGREVRTDREELVSRLPGNMKPRDIGPPARTNPPLRDGWYGAFILTPSVIAKDRQRRSTNWSRESVLPGNVERYSAHVGSSGVTVEEDVDARTGLTLVTRVKRNGTTESTTTRTFQTINGVDYFAAVTRIDVAPSSNTPGIIVEQILTDVTIAR